MKKMFEVGELVEVVRGTNHSGEIGYVEKFFNNGMLEDQDCQVKFPDGSSAKLSERILEKVFDDEPMSDQIRCRIINMMEGMEGNPENFRYLHEMAGKLSRKVTGNVIITVGQDESGNIPHFHYFRNKADWRAWKNSACFMFKENKYFDHGSHTATLKEKELKWMVKVLDMKHIGGKITNWEYLVRLWNDNNDLYEIPFNTPIPPYDYNTITRYKEKDN